MILYNLCSDCKGNTFLLKQKITTTFACMKNDIKKSFATLGSNKYAMAVLVFVIWLVGIDDNSIHRRVSLHRNVMELKERKEQLKREIEEDYRKMEDLRSVETLEKFAREEYYMKAPNEVVFIVK